MFCPNCGKEIQDNQLFCMNCGTKIPNNNNNNNDDNNQEYNYNNTYPKPQEGVLTLTRENQLVSPIFSFPIFVDGTEINKISVGETVNIKLALGQHRIEIKLLGKTIGILNVLIDDSHLSQYYNFKTDINNRVKATTTNIVNNTQNINYSSINHQQPITSYPLKPKKKKGCGYIELPQVVQTAQKQTSNGRKLKFKQQTDFVFQAESVLFLFEYDICCKS